VVELVKPAAEAAAQAAVEVAVEEEEEEEAVEEAVVQLLRQAVVEEALQEPTLPSKLAMAPAWAEPQGRIQLQCLCHRLLKYTITGT